MSPWLPEATVAIEDARFWQHGALDYQGIARAFYDDLTSGQIVQGGSTLTQQLVRNLYIGEPAADVLPQDQGGVPLRQALPRMQAKYGTARARSRSSRRTSTRSSTATTRTASRPPSETYFSKSASELNLSQAALLAGLPQAPTTYDPLVNPRYALPAAERRAAGDAEERLHHARAVPDGAAAQAARAQAGTPLHAAPPAELLRLGDAAAATTATASGRSSAAA